LSQAAMVAQRQRSPSHCTGPGLPGRTTSAPCASCQGCCSVVPSPSPSPRNTPDAPGGSRGCPCLTSALCRAAGKWPGGPGRARPPAGPGLWRRPAASRRPSRVLRPGPRCCAPGGARPEGPATPAQRARHSPPRGGGRCAPSGQSVGPGAPPGARRALASRSGAEASSSAQRCRGGGRPGGGKWRATVPGGWPGYPWVRAARLARYRRRLARIAASCWMGGSCQRAYTMRQPLHSLLQHGLAKCPGEKKISSSAFCRLGYD